MFSVDFIYYTSSHSLSIFADLEPGQQYKTLVDFSWNKRKSLIKDTNILTLHPGIHELETRWFS